MDALTKEHVLRALKEIRSAEKRKFSQSLDFVLNFTGVDFKKPEKRVSAEVALPHGRGKELKTILFAKKALATDAKELVDKVVTEEQLADLKKADTKKLANEYDIFLAEATLMGLIGKNLGTVLGPRKKIPKPVPANAKAIPPMIERLKKTILVSNKAKGDYALHAVAGTESLNDEQLAENLMAIYNAVIPQLEQGPQNLKSAYLKTTMGAPVQLGLKEKKTEVAQ